MKRRDFIKLTAVTGSGAALARCGNPEHQLIRFIPDEDIAPGIAEWKPSVCPMCRAGCGMNVRVMDADVETVRNGQAGVVRMMVAKKLEGQASHPINRGGLCARGQAAIQTTYHPDRVAQPLKREGARGSGQFKPVSWDEAIGELVAALDALARSNDQKSLAFLTRPRCSRRLELAAEFVRRFGAPPPIAYELFSDEVLRRANALSFGHEQLPTFDLARARYVLSFGADFLGTWNSPVAQNVSYGEMRQGRPGVRGKFVQVEGRMTTTGASADEWIPVRPGTDGVLALGIAHAMIANKLRPADAAGRAGAIIDGWSSGLAAYTPDRVEQITGVPAKRVDRIARELVDQLPAVAIVGGAPLAHTNGLFHALAVNALNALAGAVGEPGGVFFTPQPAPQPATRAIDALLAGDAAKVLLVDDVDPVFATPRVWNVRAALEKIPFIASFGCFIDDTSVLSDLILPDHSFLESWVDSTPESGSLEAVRTVAGPVMKPIHQTRATPDVLIDVAGKLTSPVVLPWKTYEEMLKTSGATARPGGLRADARPESRLADLQRRPNAVAYAEPQFAGDPVQYPFHFLPYASQAFFDGSTAHLPWLQELPDPLTSAMWSSWIEVNPQTAARLGVEQGDLVDVTSLQGTLRVPALLSPGIAPDIVAMPVGQGHETFTRYASRRGANPVALLAKLTAAETGTLAWAATRVKIVRAGDSDGTLITFGAELREHPHEHEVR
jgi:anaerobic selenocysteine-containing dehydrogenase